jgi:hypothetical protein
MVVKTYTRSTGAKSGSESYFIAAALVLVWWPEMGTQAMLSILLGMLTIQLCVMDKMDRNQFWYGLFSQKLGPRTIRNGSIGFAECVKPGGKPTDDHALNLYHFSGFTTTIIFAIPVFFVLVFGPVLCFVRVLYPEHWEGVPKNKLKLYWFLLRHPTAVQGEGPSNGDGLAAMNGSESIIYPITEKELEQGPKDRAYWLQEEKRPRFRDMFHDKLFCHRFFDSHGVCHAKAVADVNHHKRVETFLEPDEAPKELVWKPRYSTMGLGVEKFESWEDVDDGLTWAPSSVPYVLEEMLRSTEYDHSEWYRMTTLFAFDEAEPKPGYIWRMRNGKRDNRVQTDIIGGAYCVTNKHTPYVGPTEKGMVVDPRTGHVEPLDADVEKALSKAIDQQKKMHVNLGKELHSIGWDVMIVGGEPYFLEFNINNGFFVADHSMEELEIMATYYSTQFHARLRRQLIDFDPYAEK